MAFAEKHQVTDNIVVAFIGDGTLGEGIVYETLNMASLWIVPLLIVVENNRYAQSTKIGNNLAGSIISRAKAFNIEAGEIESNDVSLLYPRFEKIINKVRSKNIPHVEVAPITWTVNPES
jgi:TPP-dependent pyruvate/acetoin dehydrogenase alpha subunit